MTNKELMNKFHEDQNLNPNFIIEIKTDFDEFIMPGMRGKLRYIGYEDDETDGCLKVIIDLSGYEFFNDKFDPRTIFDKEQKPSLSYLDSDFYPKNGLHITFVMDYESDFNLIGG